MWHEGMVYSLLYAGVLTLPIDTVRRFAPPRRRPPRSWAGHSAPILNPGCMDLGLDYRFEIRKCPSRLAHDHESAVKISKASVATRVSPKP
jgi:hypothetical protein